MKIETIKNSDVWMSPKKAVQRMQNIFDKEGKKVAIKDDLYQQTRECWVAGAYLAVYSGLTNKLYWLQPNPVKNEAPDVTAVSFRDPISPKELGVVKEIQEIEVFEYEEHAHVSIADHIKNKVENKIYGEHCLLLCYLRKPGDSFVINDLINSLKDIKTDVQEIWVLYQLEGNQPTKLSIARVYFRDNLKGTVLIHTRDILELDQPDFVQISRGASKKVKFNHLGTLIAPLPKRKN